MIPVVWLPPTCWDQALVRRLLQGGLGRTRRAFTHVDSIDDVPFGDGAIVVVPARYHQPAAIQREIDRLPWALVMLVSDEESTFDHRALEHPAMKLWIMTPRPGVHDPAHARFLGEGWAPHLPGHLAELGPNASRHLDWSFSGQVNHYRRRRLVDVLKRVDANAGLVNPTPGFTQGLDHPSYAALLASTKVVPCPSGPATPDSFRVYEALEAGCVPVVDGHCPAYSQDGYWPLVLGEAPPFPVVEDWTQLPGVLDELLTGWQHTANRVQAWWQKYKRRHVVDLDHDLDELAGELGRATAPDDLITVLVPTSVIPSHPSTRVIEETIASVRAQLPTSEIIVMVDGVRPELHHRTPAFEEYTRRLLWLCAHQWTNVVSLVFDEHLHQGLTTRAALELVRTPQLLFVEHDTPIYPPIPWDGLTAVVTSGQANVIRLHHEAHVLEPHRHLMVDREPIDMDGVPLLRTVQWSQRPHLARTDFYRDIVRRYFGRDSRTFLEDVLHGVLDYAWRTHGIPGWKQFRVWMYAPEGDMKRSGHLDGRGDDPKFDDRLVFAYDTTHTPPGAPAPTAGRVD